VAEADLWKDMSCIAAGRDLSPEELQDAVNGSDSADVACREFASRKISTSTANLLFDSPFLYVRLPA
jgi:hypothetical protein